MLISTILLILGVLAACIAVFEDFAFRDAATTAQIRTLSRSVGISSDEILRQTVTELSGIAAGAQRDRGFKKAIKKLAKKKDIEKNKKIAVELLDDQFNQKFVTTGIIDLKKIRVYDKKFNFIVESNNGVKDGIKQLPASLLERAKPREKAERLKTLSAVWHGEEGAMLSVLAPIGGLRLVAYMEVVVNPVHNLKKIEAMMGLPVSISQTNGDVSFESESWAERVSDTTLAVEYKLKGMEDKAVLNIRILEELREMYEDMARTEYLVAGVFFVVFGLGLVVALLSLKYAVFRPIENLIKNLNSIAEGNMQVDTSSNSIISEIHSIGSATKQMVNNLNVKMLQIREIGGSLSNFSNDLSNQASGAAKNANQQRGDVDQLSEATNMLVNSITEVEQNSKITAESSKDADERTKIGTGVVKDAENSIRSVSQEVENASDAMNKLQDDVSNVETILSTIQTIAEQTNLLALNAAIEAARAGENGRGFAVVADEVRQLANRTQEATKEVNSVLTELVNGAKSAAEAMEVGQDKVGDSVKLANEAKSSLADIAEHVSKITEMNIEIAKSANQQSSVSEENNIRLTSIKNLSNQVADDASTLTQRSSELSNMAQKLDRLVDSFKLTS